MIPDVSTRDEGASGAGVDQVFNARIRIGEGEGRGCGGSCGAVRESSDETSGLGGITQIPGIALRRGCHGVTVGQPAYKFFEYEHGGWQFQASFPKRRW